MCFYIMIKETIELLQQEHYYNGSELIEIAKGKYEYTTSFKRVYEKIKRSIKYRKKNG